MSEYVYVFTNEWMPDLVKIGKADDIVDRLKQSTGAGGAATFIPCAYKCIYAIEVPDGRGIEIEQMVHRQLSKNKISESKEFFKIKPDKCIEEMEFLTSVLKKVKKVSQKDIDLCNAQVLGILPDGTPNNKKRKSNNTFTSLGIKIGSELVFDNGDDNIKCKTVNNKSGVEYNGKKYNSISALAMELTHKKSVNGFQWFSYNGKNLLDMQAENNQ